MTVLTFLGLLRLNLHGPGITHSIKSVWHKYEKKPSAPSSELPGIKPFTDEKYDKLVSQGCAGT